MKASYQKKIDGMTVRLYRGEGAGLPVVLNTDFMESGSLLVDQCSKLNCPPFHLVTISRIEWDQYLSPWPHEPIVYKDDNFTGRSPEYLDRLVHKVIPYAEEKLQSTGASYYLSGYSMAGLFSLWALYNSSSFSGAVSASGSLWYPDFLSYALTHELAAKPDAIYMSLGDREASVRNPFLRTAEDVCRSLENHYRSLGIPSVFELNPGNHNQKSVQRTAKGITWLLKNR